MFGFPIEFAAPAMLAALVILPLIWWLLRLTPPQPREQTFPPLRLLLEITKKEETPARMPWWLTALRLLLAGLIVVALADAILRSTGADGGIAGDGPVLLHVENSWASAHNFSERREAVQILLSELSNEGRPVALSVSSEGGARGFSPEPAASFEPIAEAMEPGAYGPNRAVIAERLELAGDGAFSAVIWLSDGLEAPGTKALTAQFDRIAGSVVHFDATDGLFAVSNPRNTADALTIDIHRPFSGDSNLMTVSAFDQEGRVIGSANAPFGNASTVAQAEFAIPSELRNEITRLVVDGANTAGATYLIDDRWQRRSVGMLSGGRYDDAQPLLNPLHFITAALAPYADLVEPGALNLNQAVPDLVSQRVPMIIMADIGTLPGTTEDEILDWISDGGTLVRFAGPRLAAAPDPLTPVRLRQGGRVLGGSLSWETPQALGGFSAESPFASLAVPEDVTVERQILAQPDNDLPGKTWAWLEDGTPLITAEQIGRGRLVLFHVSADTRWSNLPISKSFLELLRQLARTSVPLPPAESAESGEETRISETALPPYRILSGFGQLTAPGNSVLPYSPQPGQNAATVQNPAGLYGSADGAVALNILAADAAPAPLSATDLAGFETRTYGERDSLPLTEWFLLAAFILGVIDALVVLWMGGAGRLKMRGAATAVIPVAIALTALPPGTADAQTTAPWEAALTTRIAYVLTGNPELDGITETGLSGLSLYAAMRTALEPGHPVGVDIERDELAFFPVLYWAIDPDGLMPSERGLSRIDAFMKNGGSVIFDTRDQVQRLPAQGMMAANNTPAAQRLQAILQRLDIPRLAPVPQDHVLTKTFYLLDTFPGRWSGSPLWVEAIPERDEDDIRPARAGDGVSSILITANDFAGAWALSADGTPLLPTSPGGERQREYAFRAGVNILMYALTGNYKADQVHVPALLERLGQ